MNILKDFHHLEFCTRSDVLGKCAYLLRSAPVMQSLFACIRDDRLEISLRPPSGRLIFSQIFWDFPWFFKIHKIPYFLN
jgi:predicted Rdx family selenoprotein